jgi:hypothetical protein
MSSEVVESLIASTAPETTATTEAPVAIEIFSNEQALFTITSNPYEDGFWGQLINVHLENTTDTTLMFALENVSVNGYMVNALFATEVAAGKQANTSITIFDTELENNGITTIENIEFTLRIYDSNNWDAPNIVENSYSVSFN